MPFVNGKFYMNPAYGHAVERARAAELGQSRADKTNDDAETHWVTINHRHILIHENRGAEDTQIAGPELVVTPNFGTEQSDSENHRTQYTIYEIRRIDGQNRISKLRPEDGDHRLALIEKFTPDSKNTDTHICSKPCLSAKPNSLADTMGVTLGKPHSIVKRFTIDGIPARIYDPHTGKAYDHVRVDGKFDKRQPSFTFRYGDDPKH